MKKYDYLIVGSALYRATCANLLSKKGNKIKYRTLKFENKILDVENYQGNAVENFTSSNVKYKSLKRSNVIML